MRIASRTLSVRPDRLALPLLSLLSLLAVPALARAFSAPSPSAASAQTLKMPDGPASVRGLSDDANVGVFTGQLEYSVPIDLPKGPGGIAPALSLTYSGVLGNGPLGIGWTMSVPELRRSERQGVPSFTASDTLELSGLGEGGELVAAGDGSFRVEGQAHRIRIDVAGQGYVVRMSDGMRHVFGVSDGARREANGRVTAWLLESTEDVAGNAVRYAYVQRDGEAYLSDIVWGPRGVFGVHVVREDRADAVVSFRSGLRVQTTQRVRAIEVLAFGELRARYELTYDDSLPVTRLSSIRMQGRGGEGALPPLRFAYAAARTSSVQELTGIGGWTLYERGVSFADVDGDGLADLVRMETSGHTYRRNLGEGHFAEPKPLAGGIGLALDNARLLDVDGDSRPDLVRTVADTWRASRLANGTWQKLPTVRGSLSVPLFGPTMDLADVNGDGRTDVLADVTQGLSVWLMTSSGFLAPTRRPPIDAGNASFAPGQTQTRFVDVNGDGLTDAVFLADDWMSLGLGRGDGTFEKQQRVFYPWPHAALDPASTFLTDLNRDGLVDLVRVSAGHVEVWSGLPGPSFVSAPVRIPRPTRTDYDATVAMVDVLGDGSDDIVWSSGGRMWVLDVAGSANAGMLTRIDNGLGRTTELEYTPSAQLAIRDEASGAPWSYKLASSMPVVTRVTVSAGPGELPRVLEYAPRDGFWDTAEHALGGFLASAVRASQGPGGRVRVTETQFEAGLGDARMLRGKVRSVRTSDDAGTSFSQGDSRWATQPVDGLPLTPRTRVAVQLERSTQSYEGASTPITTRVTYAYDGEGRVIEEQSLGRLDRSGDERTWQRSYGDDASTWVRGKLCESVLLDAASQVVRREQTFYGDATRVLPLCEVGKGFVRETRRFLREGDGGRWITEQLREYDEHGNVIADATLGVQRRFAFDADALHPLTESLDLGDGKALTWAAQWDAVLGQPVALTDPAGVTAHLAYDSLARLTSVARDGQPAHLVYEYDWERSDPRTTTWRWDGRADETAPFTGAFRADVPWRQSVRVSNGAGDARYEATRLAEDRWIIDDYVERDGQGEVAFAAEPFYHGDLTISARPTDAVGTTLVRDALGRLLDETGPTGAHKRYTYGPSTEMRTLEGLATVQYERDGQGRIISTTRVVNGTREQVTAAYDAEDRLLSISMADGAVQHQFTYDTLGRLVLASDPDSGTRHMRWDDAGRLLEHENGVGQRVRFAYDAAGRITEVSTGEARVFTYHYDAGPNGETDGGTAARLAWVEEPDGQLTLSYDAFGQARTRTRTIHGSTAVSKLEWSPSGLLLHELHDDGFESERSYDAAGRAIAVGPHWRALALDAAGRVLSEQFGNGVTGVIARNALGWPESVRVARTDAELLALTITHESWGALRAVSDADGRGLDHSARYGYDEAGRLTSAALGAGTQALSFAYAYDGLQNLVRRTAQGRQPVKLLGGEYVYGVDGASPRQVAHVLASDGTRTAFHYDAAGRVASLGERSMSYDALDRLSSVQTADGEVEYDYGYDGVRTYTRGSAGDEERWFAEDLLQRDGERHHYLRIGARVVADVTAQAPAAVAAFTSPRPTPAAPSPLAALSLLTLLLALACTRRLASHAPLTRRRKLLVATVIAGSTVLGCVAVDQATPESRSDALVASSVLYLHEGLVAGPALITRADGSVEEERLHEPFGAPLAAYRDGSSEDSDVSYDRMPWNELGKTTDRDTGWSYHGARWMAPDHAAWLTPDPVTKAPDASLMAAPWDLNPYAYVRQSPTLFWDPDGERPQSGASAAQIARFAQGAARAYAYGPKGLASQLGLDANLHRQLQAPSPKPQPRSGAAQMWDELIKREQQKWGGERCFENPFDRPSASPENQAQSRIGPSREALGLPPALRENPADTYLRGVIDAVDTVKGNTFSFVHILLETPRGVSPNVTLQHIKLTQPFSEFLGYGGANTAGTMDPSYGFEKALEPLRPAGWDVFVSRGGVIIPPGK